MYAVSSTDTVIRTSRMGGYISSHLTKNLVLKISIQVGEQYLYPQSLNVMGLRRFRCATNIDSELEVENYCSELTLTDWKQAIR